MFDERFEGGRRGGIAVDEVFEDDAVVAGGEDFAVGEITVAAGPAGFRVVNLGGFGGVVVV
jgi:hypothetical protein